MGWLKILDLCQEPLPSIDSRPEPASVTKLVITRRAATRIRWSRVTLAALLRPAARRPPLAGLGDRDYLFVVQRALRQQPLYVQAQAVATAR